MRYLFFLLLLHGVACAQQSESDAPEERRIYFQQQLRFIRENPDSLSALRALNFHFSSLPYEEGLKYFAAVGTSLHASKEYKALSEQVANAALSRPGTRIPPLRLLTPEGGSLRVDSVAGTAKLTLIDFWGSWCFPCRRNAAGLKELYSKYHDKGLAVVGVSVLETDREAWRKAISEDSTGHWLQCLDDQELLQCSLGIPSVPAYLLVDNAGRILGRFNGR